MASISAGGDYFKFIKINGKTTISNSNLLSFLVFGHPSDQLVA
jgi:hypothetical protein